MSLSCAAPTLQMAEQSSQHGKQQAASAAAVRVPQPVQFLWLWLWLSQLWWLRCYVDLLSL